MRESRKTGAHNVGPNPDSMRSIQHIAEAPHRGPRARADQEAALHGRRAHPRQRGRLLRPAVRHKSLIIRTVPASVEQTEDALANDVDDG